MTLQFLMTSLMTLNQRKNRKLRNNRYLKSGLVGKLINGIPGLRLLIISLPGSALRTHVESLSKPRDVNKCSKNAWYT